MTVEQIYTGCLAQGAYYIVSNGEAAIIDPLRETEPYLKKLQKDGVVLKYVFETHFHADFVSGHIDLAAATGATIVYGPNTVTKYPVHVARDGEVFKLGNLSFEVLHTPGHTLESSCYLLKDETGKDIAIFTGDTLFVGDVGRPDLAQKANEISMVSGRFKKRCAYKWWFKISLARASTKLRRKIMSSTDLSYQRCVAILLSSTAAFSFMFHSLSFNS